MSSIDLDLVYEISDLAIAVARAIKNGDEGSFIESTILEIANTTDAIYKQHTGEPISINLIDAEPPI